MTLVVVILLGVGLLAIATATDGTVWTQANENPVTAMSLELQSVLAGTTHAGQGGGNTGGNSGGTTNQCDATHHCPPGQICLNGQCIVVRLS